MSFWQPSKARLPRTLGSNSAPGTHSKHDMMPRNVAFGSKLIKFECRCLGMLPSDQRVRAQAPCRTRGCAPRHTCRTRGCASRHPCRTSRCEGGALPAPEGALRRPFGHSRRRSGEPPATLLGSKLIKFEFRCLKMLPSEERVRAQAPLPHLKV